MTTERHLKVYSARAEHFRWIAPAAHRWLPTTPFGTLLVVCLFVVVCTVVKGLFRIWNGIAVSRLGCQIGYDLRNAVLSPRCCASTWPTSPSLAAATS